MSQRFNGLFTRDDEGGPLKPGKFSELLLEYAAPLFEGGYPPDVDGLRGALRIAMVCWNAAFLEMTGDASFRQMLAPLLTTAPEEARAIVQRLLDDRKTHYAAIPVLLDVDVTGTDVATARIVARAHHPARPPAVPPPAPRAQPRPPAPAISRPELSQRHAVKVGANDECPCGSGRKYKKCCRQ